LDKSSWLRNWEAPVIPLLMACGITQTVRHLFMSQSRKAHHIPAFHAGDVIAGDTNWIEPAFVKHFDEHFK